MTQIFEGSFIDPFDLSDPSDHLVNFATVVIASSEIEVNSLDEGSQMASNKSNQIKSNQSNQIDFIGIKSSHRTVTSHMYTITQ